MNTRTITRALNRFFLCATALTCSAAFAQSTSVAIINIQDAITRTQEGQKLLKELEVKYEPRSQEIQALQTAVNDLRAQLNKGANTMSEAARRELARKIQQKELDAKRGVEDARGEFSQSQQEIFQTVGGKLMTVIDKFAKEKGYAIVLDISTPQSPVLYAVNEVNITNDVITAYDAIGTGAPSADSSGAAGKPAQ